MVRYYRFYMYLICWECFGEPLTPSGNITNADPKSRIIISGWSIGERLHDTEDA